MKFTFFAGTWQILQFLWRKRFVSNTEKCHNTGCNKWTTRANVSQDIQTQVFSSVRISQQDTSCYYVWIFRTSTDCWGLFLRILLFTQYTTTTTIRTKISAPVTPPAITPVISLNFPLSSSVPLFFNFPPVVKHKSTHATGDRIDAFQMQFDLGLIKIACTDLERYLEGGGIVRNIIIIYTHLENYILKQTVASGSVITSLYSYNTMAQKAHSSVLVYWQFSFSFWQFSFSFWQSSVLVFHTVQL